MNYVYMVKKSQWKLGILSKIDIMNMTHFTVVNLEILTVLKGNFCYDTVTLNLIEEKCQDKVLWLFFASFT